MGFVAGKAILSLLQGSMNHGILLRHCLLHLCVAGKAELICRFGKIALFPGPVRIVAGSANTLLEGLMDHGSCLNLS